MLDSNYFQIFVSEVTQALLLIYKKVAMLIHMAAIFNSWAWKLDCNAVMDNALNKCHVRNNKKTSVIKSTAVLGIITTVTAQIFTSGKLTASYAYS